MILQKQLAHVMSLTSISHILGIHYNALDYTKLALQFGIEKTKNKLLNFMPDNEAFVF